MDEKSGSEGEDGPGFNSFSTVSAARNVLINLYKRSGEPVDEKTKSAINDQLDGYKRIIGCLKQQGIKDIHEGKDPLTIVGYRYLSDKAFNGSNYSQSTFMFLYLLLCCNVGEMMYRHISWGSDSLVIELPKTKSDQRGEKGTPKHVFANPLDASCCPVLALGKLSVCYFYYYHLLIILIVETPMLLYILIYRNTCVMYSIMY